MSHAKFANLAERLIRKHGRPGFVRKLSQQPKEDDMPWRGGDDEDPDEGYEYNVEVMLVEATNSEDVAKPSSFREGDKMLLVAAKPTDAEGIDLRFADSVLDLGEPWGIQGNGIVYPGMTRILFMFHVRQ